jgi:hypothetical protein
MDWKLLEAKIIAAVTKVAKQHYEVYEERWVTDEELCQHVSLMTRRWLRENGYLLPRTPIVWLDKKGEEHVSKQYLYPLHKILAMVEDGRIKRLGFNKVA